MIVISKHTNQLCNRLFTYLPVLSYAIEANEPVCFLFQYKGYNDFFPNLAKENILSYCTDGSLKASLLSKFFNALVRGVDKCVHLVIKPGEPLPLKKPLGLLFNPKWKEIRYDKAYIEKHSDRLRYLFAPSKAVEDRIDDIFGHAQEDVVTVGVHLRRGDYKTYLDGKYYYDTSVYIDYMRQMTHLLSEQGKQVRFLLCSNERLDDALFSDFSIIKQQGSDMMVDLYGLSRCNYIMGPPSTYSQWASFYGKKPLKVLDKASLTISLDDFEPIRVLDNL